MTFYEHIKLLQETRQKLIDGINEDIAETKRTTMPEYYVNVYLNTKTNKQHCGWQFPRRDIALAYAMISTKNTPHIHVPFTIRVIPKVQNQIASTRL